ncbi:7,8-dihydroneopterin aldolase [Candidatus Hydrogenisulfobacillus filiaventi]|uniref:7,8-dihydroneopterin aldolase n=1 Tax=Candidatus Hydrogenisulfobacillus filiaventi TaxID=2707344 RepID=A0A6F8ZK20_9FIRM|nr:dihydroneopterin aldolase [Bacillota bacterium]CAB1130016.1 7,8-dihydroneopterin aldolase [Candidatus Hydrogenisulfobacillus filiaventi]
MTGWIRIMGMQFQARHGALPYEQERPQPFAVDIEVETDFSRAVESDQVGDTVDYGRLYAVAARVMAGPPVRLLEALAGRMAGEVLALDGVERVVVRIRKQAPPLPGPVAYSEVEVSRHA